MKTNLLKTTFIVCISLILFSAVFIGCKNEEDPVVVADQTKLTALVDSCTAILARLHCQPIIQQKQLLLFKLY